MFVGFIEICSTSNFLTNLVKLSHEGKSLQILPRGALCAILRKKIFRGKRMKTLKKSLILILILAMLLPLAACGEDRLVTKQIFAMDTSMILKAYGKHADEALEAALGEINSLNISLDPENEQSMVYELNKRGYWGVVAKSQIAGLLKACKEYYTLTGGAFNPAVYPLVKAWGFIDGSYRVPSEEEIDELLKYIDFGLVEISAFPGEESYMIKTQYGMQISFAAIGKGYASDVVIDAMRARGVKSAIVSLGGNIKTLGTKPDGSMWTIAIQDPEAADGFIGYLKTADKAVVTSGGYNRFFIAQDGKTYSHILNPSNGMPADSGLTSVTVVCDNAAKADALSTALYVMGEAKALKLYRESKDFELILVTTDSRVVVTNGLYDYFSPDNPNYDFSYASSS